MNALSIASTSIRQFDGLYSLNDLHQSSGGNKNHRPNQWLRLEQTQALIAVRQTGVANTPATHETECM